jgi:ribonucrease Y
MPVVYILIGLILGAAIAVGGAFLIFKRKQNDEAKAGRDAVSKAETVVSDAEKRSDSLRKEAQTEARDIRARAKAYENETREMRLEFSRMEQRLVKKEESIEKMSDLVTNKEIAIQNKEKIIAGRKMELVEREAQITGLEDDVKVKLEKVARLSADEAKDELIKLVIDEAKMDAAKEVKLITETAKDEAEDLSKRIIGNAVVRYAGEYSGERLVSVVNLPNDEMKGRIIGREGRNIRAFEAATGVDVIIDDTPEAVILSSFSGVKREVARLSMEKLISDGRIHPGRIEEIVKKTEQDVEITIKQAGEHAVMDLGIYGMHAELVKVLGRLKYRTSYGQNVLAHSIEVAHLAGLLGAELGIKIKLCKRAGLLHDIGKALTHEVEGPHALVGAQLAKKYGESDVVLQALAGHHGEGPADNMVTQIVMAADALSGARPGARREMLESYVKRLEDLERIAVAHDGVDKAYAFQAGREVRVLVDSSQVTDDSAVIMCSDIAKQIQEEMTFPGQIKVVVVRETRSVSFAN